MTTTDAKPTCLRIEGVSQMTTLTVEQIRDLVRRKRFPAPLKVGHRTRIWPVSSIEKWLADSACASVG